MRRRPGQGTNLDFEDEKWWLEGETSSESSEVEDAVKQEDKAEGKHKSKLDWETKWKKKFDTLYKQNVEKPRAAREKSEAVLACPGCFTVLCDRCQGHESIFNQWRALVATNVVIEDEKLHADDGYPYRNVHCEVCEAHVGAFGIDDEVYHFFNILPTASS